MRAAWRPSVECRTAGVSVAPATLPAVSSVFTAQRFVGSWPCAKPTSTCASGPTCMTWPSKRGALIHEYFPSASYSEYFGTVSSSYGCRCQSPSYQECAIDSDTFFWKYGSPNDVIGVTCARSPLKIVPPGKSNVVPAAVEREVRHRQVVRDAGAVLQPVGVHRADGAHVDEVDLLDEGLHLVEQVLHLVQLRHVQRRVVVQVDGVGDAADGEVLDVRRLAAEDGDHLVRLALVVERLQVVRHGEQVHLRRQLHRRVAPVAVREDAELPLGDEAGQPVLHRLELLRAVARPVRQAGGERGGLRRVGLERRDDVDPVERRQLVEVDDVIVQRVRDHDEVADVLRVLRDLELQRVLDRAHRRDGVHRGADAAEALREEPGVARVAPLQDPLDAAEHLPGRPGLA